MKPLRTYRLRYYARQTIVGTLMCVGLIALSGEPTEDTNWIVCLLLQLLTWATTWATALWLYRHWEIGKQEKRIEYLQRKTQTSPKTSK